MSSANANLGIDLWLDADGDLSVAPDGDLAITPNGRVTLLQDVRDLLDTLPGDLFGHPTYGAGVARLFGEEDRPDFEALVIRAIADALTYDPSVAPRIEPDSITVRPTTAPEPREAAFTVSFVPLGEEWTNALNLGWGLLAPDTSLGGAS
jgi:hypothetical protein